MTKLPGCTRGTSWGCWRRPSWCRCRSGRLGVKVLRHSYNFWNHQIWIRFPLIYIFPGHIISKTFFDCKVFRQIWDFGTDLNKKWFLWISRDWRDLETFQNNCLVVRFSQGDFRKFKIVIWSYLKKRNTKQYWTLVRGIRTFFNVSIFWPFLLWYY